MSKNEFIPPITESGLEFQTRFAAREADTTLNNPATGSRTAVPLRRTFVVTPTRSTSPLTLLVGGRAGRGGGTRLKLLLSLLWHAKRDDPTVTRKSLHWAKLIGLIDPERELHADPNLSDAQAQQASIRKGKARVNAALKWLSHADHQFISLTQRPGKEPVVRLNEETLRRNDDGTPIPYSPPGKLLKENLVPADERHWHGYLQLPAHLWTSGAIARLDGAGLATLLIFLHRLPKQRTPSDPGIFWTTNDWADLYGLSPELRYRGFHQLESAGILRHDAYPLFARFAPEGARFNLEAPDGRYYEYYLEDRKLDGRSQGVPFEG